MAADVMSCALQQQQKIHCENLHWAWEGVYSFILQEVMSLASTNPHQNAACRDSASLVALQPLRYRDDTQWCDSMQVSQAGCRCDEV